VRLAAAPALALALVGALWSCGGDPTGPGAASGVLQAVDGDGQSGPVGLPLPAPFRVKAADRGTPLEGREIRWRLVSSPGEGAVLEDSVSITDAAGIAGVTLTLGPAVGAYVVRAETDGGSVEFTASAEAVVRTAEIVSGAGQVGLVEGTLPDPLVARFSTDGQPAAGVRVQFSVTAGDGSVAPTETVTDAGGAAAATLTLGDHNGRVRVSVSDGVNSTSFEAWACGGDAAAGVVNLAVGADTTIAGSSTGCVQFGPTEASARYEAMITSGDPVLGFHPIEMFLRGTGASGSVTAAPTPADGLEPRSRLGPQYALDWKLRQMEAPLRPRIRELASREKFALADIPAEGDTLTFRFTCGSSTARRDIAGVVLAIGEKGIIVEDTSVSERFTGAEAAAIAANFDDVIYATDTTYFGAPGDIDGNGRVILLFTAAVNELADANPGGYDDGIVAGFFCPTDLGFSGGNDAEMFYLVAPDPTGEFTDAADAGLGKSEVLRFVNGTVAHEFQHLVNAQTGSGGAFDVWLNEGLSHLAEEVVGHAATGFTPGTDLTLSNYDAVPNGIELFNTYHVGNWYNLHEYLEAPSDTAGLVMTSDPLGNQTFRLRGAAWSFLRYLLDRFETKAGEPSATRALIADGSADSRDAIENVFEQPFDELVADWSTMLMLDDRNPLAPRPALTLPSYRLRQMYSELGARSPSFPPGGVPLPYAERRLDRLGGLRLDLYSYAAAYIGLEAPAGSSATGIRFGRPDTAEDLPAAADVRVRIVRIR
jgi:hypothetical protein